MIGIIGFGRFGKLAARYLAEDYDVCIHTRADKASEIEAIGARPVSLEKACRQRIVIPCVPISIFRDFLKQIKGLINPDALIVDVCSVKEYPIQWMEEILPDTVSILATHPMFGPDSAADSLEGRKICLCKVKINDSQYRKIRIYLRSKGLVVIEATAKEHDEQIATSLALTHLIGRTLSESGATPLDIDTEGYKRLLHILEVVERDTWQLFTDMHHYNPYARKKRIEFMDVMQDLNSRLENGKLVD
ncbi:MAG: prephenate dehydrogenase/arogenate dehydrogenase family protein [Desulfobacterales bacterium]|nr:prephenate dehydrogenase/arogenate dehydrogenase family protein [Desulfobacterales bacterium]